MTPTTLEPAPCWRPVCAVVALARGAALSLHVAGRPVAVFRTWDGELFALADVDPHVTDPAEPVALSTGRIASRRDVPVVVGPSGRRFELARGVCVDGGASVTPFPVRVTDGAVEIAVPAA